MRAFPAHRRSNPVEGDLAAAANTPPAAAVAAAHNQNSPRGVGTKATTGVHRKDASLPKHKTPTSPPNTNHPDTGRRARGGDGLRRKERVR